jgi:hypothetical protein
MPEQYDLYCIADRIFYDTPSIGSSTDRDFPAASRPTPAGWAGHSSDTWMHYAPQGASVRLQGWKIHASSSIDDAERVIDAIWDYCVSNGIPFKFLRSAAVMLMLNSKAAFRGSSGKLVTVYPHDDGDLEQILTDLQPRLQKIAGPYILSDLRHGDSPLFVRYGGFVGRHCLNEQGERVLALENDEGRLVPDVRGPVFSMPPWVTCPEFLKPDLDARNSVTTTGLPYHIENAVQFSNGGGVYLARDTHTNDRVVLKEGRPHAGLDAAGRDAVARLSHERHMLERLAGLDSVPALIDYFTLGDHHFLVEEFIDGSPLQRLLVSRYPLTHPGSAKEDLAAYAEWALGMLARVERAVDSLHERGVVFGDLHPSNVLVSVDDRLVLIDFEVSTLAEEGTRSALAHPGFQAPTDRTGPAVDHYALACMHLGMFAPQTTILLPLHQAKAAQLADVVGETFPVPREATLRALDTIMGGSGPPETMRDLPVPGVAPWPAVRDAMTRAILASATPERDDRLFPGDVAQFEPGGGINFAHGAAGVLYALAATGAERVAEHGEWLRRHARADELGNGFYNGRHGVAYVLDRLGHRQDAFDLLASGTDQVDSLELGLYSGLAGIGLNLLNFARLTGEPAFAELAGHVVDIVASRLGGPDDVAEISGGNHARAGLMHGSSGPALLFLHAYERAGDTTLLDLAELALRQDLRRCIRTDDGTLQVNQDWRTLPYLDEGSAGIALVLARYLAHRPDSELASALSDLVAVTRAGYFVQPGLFTGRAGMIATAGMLASAASDVQELIRGLSWHTVPYADGLAFPGDQLMRLSMDFATGTAGVLFSIGTAEVDRPTFLPFFEPPACGGKGGHPTTPRRPESGEYRKEV